jgi:DNA-binding transcriptional ArsR family regulator
MVNRHEKNLDRIFRALADPTRRRILLRVARSSCTVAELAEPFSISAPAISRHLKVLEDAQMIVRFKSGKYHRMSVKTGACRSRSARAGGRDSRQLNFAPLRDVLDWVDLFEARWDKHLLQLKQQVESDL